MKDVLLICLCLGHRSIWMGLFICLWHRIFQKLRRRPYVKKKYGYMDLSGNCYILTKCIMIYITGKQNKYVELRAKKNYFSKCASAASRIMRTILDAYKKIWQVRELSEVTGKAIGTVSNVKSFLRDHAWIEEQGSHFASQTPPFALLTFKISRDIIKSVLPPYSVDPKMDLRFFMRGES